MKSVTAVNELTFYALQKSQWEYLGTQDPAVGIGLAAKLCEFTDPVERALRGTGVVNGKDLPRLKRVRLHERSRW
jgi:hypothetical protein